MTAPAGAQRPPVAILAGAFLFNLGQGALRPSLPLYLQRIFAANYRMVTLIPVVFGSFGLGALAGVIAPIPTALTSDLVEAHLQGVAIGWLRTTTDGGQILGPLLMGAVADLVDLSAPFLCGAALLGAVAWCCHDRAHAVRAAAAAREP
jgi:MFS family permease